MHKILVIKFGGTSVGSAEAMQQVVSQIQIARQKWSQLVVVISAVSGVTDLLLSGARLASLGDEEGAYKVAHELDAKHRRIICELLQSTKEKQFVESRLDTHIQEFRSLCHAIYVLGEASPRALDAVSSLGERISVHILAARLRETHCDARSVLSSTLIRTDSYFQAANPDMDMTRELSRTHLLPMLEQQIVPIVTGFIGSTESGAITTLGRGGSDYSAGILAVALEASELWICTDVDGVMTTDPRIASNAKTLGTIAHNEIVELASAGAQVVHPKAIGVVMNHNIDLWIRNTFNPEGSATQVLPVIDVSTTQKRRAKAVTAVRSQSLIMLEGRGMLGVQGIAARTFDAAARVSANVTLIAQTSSEQSILFAVPSIVASKVVLELEREFYREFEWNDIEAVKVQDNVVIVTVIGSGLFATSEFVGRLFTALGEKNVDVLSISQGTTGGSISVVVSKADTENSVRAIHELIVGMA
tara:strand:- start:1185 stop:2606 length:1422 start_codon:yes stop_codon:yes gene_type:complete